VRAAVLALALAVASGAASAKEVPYLSGRIVDEPGMLSTAARTRIESELEAVERQTGDQVVVLIVASLEGEPLETFSVKVAHTWKLGQKGKDNGVLLLVARDDRKMRIEVGYGLEGTITDLASNEIIDGQMRPRFRGGDFDGGVEQSVLAISKLLEGQPLPPPVQAAARSQSMPVGERLAFGAFFLVVVGLFSCIAIFSTGGQSWFLYVFLLPFYLIFPTAFASGTVALAMAGVWLVGFPLVKLLRRNAKPSQSSFGHFLSSHGSGGSSGGSWSSSSSSSSSSSDSFSGGGGDFGGGGASGSW
jgi:uncharacterized protein